MKQVIMIQWAKSVKKTCKYLNYVEHLLILASAITGCVSISAFTPLVAVGVKICTISTGIKKYR